MMTPDQIEQASSLLAQRANIIDDLKRIKELKYRPVSFTDLDISFQHLDWKFVSSISIEVFQKFLDTQLCAIESALDRLGVEYDPTKKH